MEKYKSFAQWANAQHRPINDSDFISAVGALAVAHLGAGEYQHDVAGDRIGALLMPHQVGKQRMHRFFEEVVDASTQLSVPLRNQLTDLYISDIQDPQDESMSNEAYTALWQPAIDATAKGGSIVVHEGSRRQTLHQLEGISQIAIETAGILEPTDPQEGITMRRKVKLYQPDLNEADPWLELERDKSYEVKRPGIVQVSLSRPHSRYILDIACFPISYARYDKFQSIAGLKPDEAQEVLMQRVGRNGKGHSQEDVVGAIQDGRRTYRPASLQVVVSDRTKGRMGVMQGEFAERRHGSKIAQGFLMRDARSGSKARSFITLREIPLNEVKPLQRNDSAIQLAKDLIDLSARPPRRLPTAKLSY